ncbi:hypothetical protein ACS5PN_31230 [Roseateles sp. NT4]|uniref:hypothetical protein n=1 Tax=Roseateles sp. NT4 TaxID=3453715 RepID=UPI003EECE8BB
MNFIQNTSLLLVCALAFSNAHGTESNDSCKANNDALDALHRSASASHDAVVEVEKLFELNQPQRVKVAKVVPWSVAEALIRSGLVRSIEQPTPGRQFIFFGISGKKYSSTHPQNTHPYDIARQVDPCDSFISVQTVD